MAPTLRLVVTRWLSGPVGKHIYICTGKNDLGICSDVVVIFLELLLSLAEFYIEQYLFVYFIQGNLHIQ